MIDDGSRHFHDFDGQTYLNCANQGPLPRVSLAEIEASLGLKSHPNRITDDVYFAIPNRVRRAVAPLIGAGADTIFLGSGESHGASTAALGFPWRPGDELVMASSDFPANVYIWVHAARLAGARPVVIRGARRAAVTEEILAAVNERTRVVAVSWVDFGSGQVMDLERLGAVCRERGIFLAVDGTQGVGAMPMDMAALGISLLSVAAYKWMLGPYGTGFAALSPEWIDRIEPRYVTWTAAEGAERFNTLPREDWRWVRTARRFDAPETASFLNMNVLARSAELLGELGVDSVHTHIRGLLDSLEKNLPPGFRRRDLPADRRGPILSIEGDDVERVHAAYARVRAAGIVVSLREDGIRVSPHIYNDLRDVETLVRLLEETP